jgi:hypothetical protein
MLIGRIDWFLPDLGLAGLVRWLVAAPLSATWLAYLGAGAGVLRVARTAVIVLLSNSHCFHIANF